MAFFRILTENTSHSSRTTNYCITFFISPIEKTRSLREGNLLDQLYKTLFHACNINEIRILKSMTSEASKQPICSLMNMKFAQIESKENCTGLQHTKSFNNPPKADPYRNFGTHYCSCNLVRVKAFKQT